MIVVIEVQEGHLASVERCVLVDIGRVGMVHLVIVDGVLVENGVHMHASNLEEEN